MAKCCCSYFQIIFLFFTSSISKILCLTCDRQEDNLKLVDNFSIYAIPLIFLILVLNIVLFIFVKRKYLLIILISALVLHYIFLLLSLGYLYWIHYPDNGCNIKPWHFSDMFDDNAVVIISSILIQVLNIVAIAAAFRDYKISGSTMGYYWNLTTEKSQLGAQKPLESCEKFPAPSCTCHACQSTGGNMIGYNGTWYQHEEWCALVHGWGAHDQPTSNAANEIKKYGYNGTLYQNAVECNDVRKV